MTDGPGSVSTLTLVVARGTEEARFPENDVFGEFGIGGVLEWVGDKDEGDGKKDVDEVESEGTADARAATMRVRTAGVHMNA